ncbi:MAG: hypothetical protein ACRCWB_09420 [Enterovibrio sp.]
MQPNQTPASGKPSILVPAVAEIVNVTSLPLVVVRADNVTSEPSHVAVELPMSVSMAGPVRQRLSARTTARFTPYLLPANPVVTVQAQQVTSLDQASLNNLSVNFGLLLGDPVSNATLEAAQLASLGAYNYALAMQLFFADSFIQDVSNGASPATRALMQEVNKCKDPYVVLKMLLIAVSRLEAECQDTTPNTAKDLCAIFNVPFEVLTLWGLEFSAALTDSLQLALQKITERPAAQDIQTKTMLVDSKPFGYSLLPATLDEITSTLGLMLNFKDEVQYPLLKYQFSDTALKSTTENGKRLMQAFNKCVCIHKRKALLVAIISHLGLTAKLRTGVQKHFSISHGFFTVWRRRYAVHLSIAGSVKSLLTTIDNSNFTSRNVSSTSTADSFAVLDPDSAD